MYHSHTWTASIVGPMCCHSLSQVLVLVSEISLQPEVCPEHNVDLLKSSARILTDSTNAQDLWTYRWTHHLDLT